MRVGDFSLKRLILSLFFALRFKADLDAKSLCEIPLRMDFASTLLSMMIALG